MIFKNKNIIIGVTGGIAVYKTVDLVSKLVKMGANVHVIMTKSAMEFVTPLTFMSISKNDVITDMFKIPDNSDIKHISLANKADIIIVAPATLNVIGKVATGIADDFLTTTISACKAPVLFVPAMNHNMYQNSIFQKNKNKLIKHGYSFVEPEEGWMACGTYGEGRFPKSDTIIDSVNEILIENKTLDGISILITAGPTHEAIDPVRYISNKSSGKMGYSIANIGIKLGAKIKLISGPVNIKADEGIDLVNVVSASEMYDEVINSYKEFDVVIMVAAVADYRVDRISDSKLKKGMDKITLNLVKNLDILKELGNNKESCILVGFCAETENLIENAKEKLINKNLDIIVANDVTLEGAGFGTDTNIVSIIDNNGKIYNVEKSNKKEIAKLILNRVRLLYKEMH